LSNALKYFRQYNTANADIFSTLDKGFQMPPYTLAGFPLHTHIFYDNVYAKLEVI